MCSLNNKTECLKTIHPATDTARIKTRCARSILLATFLGLCAQAGTNHRSYTTAHHKMRLLGEGGHSRRLLEDDSVCAPGSFFEKELKADGNIIAAGLANDQKFITDRVSEMTEVYEKKYTDVRAFWEQSSQWLVKKIKKHQKKISDAGTLCAGGYKVKEIVYSLTEAKSHHIHVGMKGVMDQEYSIIVDGSG